MPPVDNPPTRDGRIAAATAAGDWPTVNALNAEKLAELQLREAAANARHLAAPAPAASAATTTPPLDEQIADATAQREWPRLNALNAQKLAGLIAEQDGRAVELSVVGEQLESERGFRLHTELDPTNPDHATALAEIDRARMAAKLHDAVEQERAHYARRQHGRAGYLPS